MLARMQGTLVNTFLKKPDHNLRRLVQDIAEHSGIRPLSTQGHLGDIVGLKRKIEHQGGQ